MGAGCDERSAEGAMLEALAPTRGGCARHVPLPHQLKAAHGF